MDLLDELKPLAESLGLFGSYELLVEFDDNYKAIRDMKQKLHVSLARIEERLWG
jgi:hypothetical protein